MSVAGLLLWLVGAILGLGLLLRLTHPLPRAERCDRPPARDPAGTRLAALAAGAPAAEVSAIRALSDAHQAFAARLELAQTAQATIDAQYYTWQDDLSGRLLLDALEQAADRGVRVRLLLDDNGTYGLDAVIAAIVRHPMIDVRLFNPFVIRRPKAIGYIMDFFRLNRRMHNKSFTVDRAATIIGGRNIGDEYFGARAGDLFADLDVLAVGRIAAVVADDFERYWQSTAAFAAETLLADVAIQSAAERAIRLIELRASGRAYLDTIAAVPPILADGVGDGFEWVRVKMVSDDPDKVKGRLHRRQTLVGRLDQILERPRVEMGLVSGYFVPGRGGAASFVDLARQGVAITVLTNSVRATDVAIVHAGYLRYRRRLLRAGIRLYELCGGEPLGGRRRGHRRGRLRRLFIASGAETFGKSLTQSNRHQPAIRSSGSVLHAKTFTIDRERIFIGSFNLDPRSRDLNTELGFLIESPHLAGELSDMLAEARALEVYELELTADGRLCWVDWRHGTAQRHFVEPGTTRAGRLGMRLLALLPIEWML